MCSIKAWSVIFAVLAVLFYLFYKPLPCCEDIPTHIRLSLHLIPFTFTLASWFEKLGLAREVEVLRKFKPPKLEDTEALRTLNTNFDGVPVRVYMPSQRPANSAAVVYLHGGGWVMGSVDHSDKLVRSLAEKLSVLAISVEYRLAPEWKYPAAVDDTERVYKYLVEHAADYGIDASRIAIAGDSAGGNLAAALTIRLRDASLKAKLDRPSQLQHALPQPKLQILLYPVLQSINFSSPSMLNKQADIVVPRFYKFNFILQYALGMDYYNVTLRSLAARYLDQSCYRSKYKDVESIFSQNAYKQDIRERILTDNDRAFMASLRADASEKDLINPRCSIDNEATLNELHARLQCVLEAEFSPLLSRSVEHLPPAYIISCGYDRLRDEAWLFVERLRLAGVFVEHRYEPNMFHGYASYYPEKTASELRDFLARNALL